MLALENSKLGEYFSLLTLHSHTITVIVMIYLITFTYLLNYTQHLFPFKLINKLHSLQALFMKMCAVCLEINTDCFYKITLQTC